MEPLSQSQPSQIAEKEETSKPKTKKATKSKREILRRHASWAHLGRGRVQCFGLFAPLSPLQSVGHLVDPYF